MDSTCERGFTLYELLVTVLVAGVVFGLGVPNLLEFTRNGRMAATANDFVTAVHLARGEAVTRRTPVTLCASANPVDAAPGCSAGAWGPDDGYIVWIDTDSDAVADSDEEIVYQRSAPSGVALLADSGYLHFGASGFIESIPSAGTSASLVLFCDTRGKVMATGGLSAARAVRIPPTGRPAMLRDVAEITPLALDCP
jgi:type IV fimbrial biogenesis protein FimT